MRHRSGAARSSERSPDRVHTRRGTLGMAEPGHRSRRRSTAVERGHGPGAGEEGDLDPARRRPEENARHDPHLCAGGRRFVPRGDDAQRGGRRRHDRRDARRWPLLRMEPRRDGFGLDLGPMVRSGLWRLGEGSIGVGGHEGGAVEDHMGEDCGRSLTPPPPRRRPVRGDGDASPHGGGGPPPGPHRSHRSCRERRACRRCDRIAGGAALRPGAHGCRRDTRH